MAQAQTRTQFVGRDRELDELLAALNDTRAGRGRAVLIGGEPGIGKSRLADELTVRAQSSNWLPLWGRAWEDAGAPPYWPWVQALRTLVRTLDRDEIVRCVGSGGADIAQMLPELREHLPDLPPPTSADSETARFQLFDSTTSLLRRVATERPLLIILDDLHAADTPSILFLRFLATQLADMGLLVVGTYRDLELTPEHPLTLAISEMARQSATRLMMLGGLTSDAVSDYIRSAAEIEPDGLAVAAVWRETNGNPLFVGEAVRLLQAEGKLTEVGDLTSLRFAVPSGVRAVISRRIGHLAEDTSAALRVGAVIGPEFALEVLRRVLELNSARAGAAMDEAAQAGLLVPVSTGAVRFRFSHDLVRETLYDAVPLYERAEMHRRIAETLEAIHGAASAQHLAELAFHYNQAAQLGADDQVSTRDKAIVYARRAGDQAARALAYEEASQLYAMALAALAAGDTEDPRERTELLLALGDADARTGDLDRARGSFVEASRLAREIGSGELLARAALGYGGRHQWARAGKDTLLIPLLRDAMTSLGAGDERLRVRVQTRLAGAMRSDPTQRDECDRLSAEAVALARDLDDADTLGFALAGRFWATWWPENPEERRRLLDEIEKIAAAIGDGEWISQAALLRFMFLFESGRIDEASGQVDRLIEVVRRTRQPAQLWLEPVSRAELALFRGDFELAEELIAEQFKTAYRVNPSKDDRSAAMMHRFLIRREQGRLAEIEVELRAASVEFTWYPCHKAALSIALLELDRADEARFVFAQLAANDFALLYHDNEWLFGIALTAEACALLGDRDAASVLYEQLVPFSGRHATGHMEGSMGPVDRYLGVLAWSLGRGDDADRHLRAAIDQLHTQRGLPWLARTQHDLATVLRGRGDTVAREDASQLDAEALKTAQDLGMVALAARIGLSSELAPTIAGARIVASEQDRGLFAREGDSWAVAFGADAFQVRDSKGMHHLARLLRAPGREMHSLDLVNLDATAGSTTGGTERARAETDLEAGDLSDTGPTLDAEAKAAYRERLTLIGEDIAEAERWNDPERVARLHEERDALIHELAAAVGLGNRDRVNASSSAERARVSVTRAIRAAMERIAEYSPALGAHLEATIRTGTFCAYMPDPRAPLEWRN